MAKWETIGGVPNRGEIFAKLLENIREAEELAAMMAHLHNTEDNHMDKLLAKGWLGISELFRQVAIRVTKLAQGRLQ